MSEQDLFFEVNGTDVALIHAPLQITAGSINANQCCFSFNSVWDTYGGKIAYFGADRDRMVPVLLAEEDGYFSCHIPRMVLATLATGGALYLCVQGTDAAGTAQDTSDDAVLRTKLFQLAVHDSGGLQLYLTPDEAQSFLNQAGAVLSLLENKRIKSAAVNANHNIVLTLQDNSTVTVSGSVKGDTGEQGIQGIQGVQGEKGDKGDTGNTGAAGADGKSAYQVAVEEGFSGTASEWLASLKGEKGDTGNTGAQGIQGVQGPAGSDAKQIASAGADASGNLKLIFTDGSSLTTSIPIQVSLTVNGVSSAYNLQQLAAYFIAEIEKKKNKTIVTGTDGNRYEARFDMQNGQPVIITEAVNEQ